MHFYLCLILALSSFLIVSAKKPTNYYSKLSEGVLVKLTQENGAKCLDGSPFSLYVKKGKSKNYLFYFQGGAWCYGDTHDETLNDCVQRSKSNLGSSTKLQSKIGMGGIFSSDIEFNPYFNDFNVVILNYCDGNGFQGHVTEPITYKNTQIWFRGKQNTLEALNYAKSVLGMDKADTVVVTGSSAGGLAAYTWVDYIAEDMKKSNPSVQVYGIGDGGVFLNAENHQTNTFQYQLRMRNIFSITNQETGPINEKCGKAFPNEQWRCMFSQYLLNYIDTPTLIVNSGYDSWSLPVIAGIPCVLGASSLQSCSSLELAQANKYHLEFEGVIESLQARKPNIGSWIVSCITHTFMWSDTWNYLWEVPADSSWTIQKTAKSFVKNNEMQRRIDSVIWPYNSPCSGISQYF